MRTILILIIVLMIFISLWLNLKIQLAGSKSEDFVTSKSSSATHDRVDLRDTDLPGFLVPEEGEEPFEAGLLLGPKSKLVPEYHHQLHQHLDNHRQHHEDHHQQLDNHLDYPRQHHEDHHKIQQPHNHHLTMTTTMHYFLTYFPHVLPLISISQFCHFFSCYDHLNLSQCERTSHLKHCH